MHVARTQGATVVSTLLYLTPPTTMVWVYLMFGTPLTLVAVAGLAVSAVGVGLVLHGRRSGARAQVASGVIAAPRLNASSLGMSTSSSTPPRSVGVRDRQVLDAVDPAVAQPDRRRRCG